jgi:hypothetical protein
MTVQELIDQLLLIENKDREVIMAKDSEGNNHSPLYSSWLGAYKAETTWYGEVGFESLEQGRKECDWDDEDIEEAIIEDGVPALILCPVN